MTTERDIRNQIKYAHKTGVQEGFAEGEAQGEAKGKAIGLAEGEAKGIEKGAHEKQLSIARAMLTEGLDISMISRTTGLSLDDLKALA